MNTNTPKSEAIDKINRQIAILEHRKEIVSKLLEERNTIEDRLNKVLGGEENGGEQIKEERKPIRKQKQLALPRGVLTAASFVVLSRANKPMQLKDITEEVKKSPLLAGNIPEDLDRRVRGVLQTSDQFKNVGGNSFTNASSKLEGKLFERLMGDIEKTIQK